MLFFKAFYNIFLLQFRRTDEQMRPNVRFRSVIITNSELLSSIPWAAFEFKESKWTDKINFLYYNPQIPYYDINCAFFGYTKINKRGMVQVLTLILLTWRLWWAPNNASKWQMRFNSAFKVLINNNNNNLKQCARIFFIPSPLKLRHAICILIGVT
jgi:hypothetical protein